MNFSKKHFLLVLVALLKIVSTCLTICTSLNVTFLSIVSIPFCFAVSYHKNYVFLAFIALLLLIVTWGIMLIFTFCGLKNKKLRKISTNGLSILSAVDVIVSFFIASTVLRIQCIIGSIALLSICLYCMFTYKKS